MRKRKTSRAKNARAARPGPAKPSVPRAATEPRQAAKEPAAGSLGPPFPPAKTSNGFPVVGVGASAGGLEALEELFRDMPANTGIAFVVVSHLHPGHTSMLPELLGKITRLAVSEASDGIHVRPNHVYVGAPGG